MVDFECVGLYWLGNIFCTIKKKQCNQNIAVISGALFTFQIQYEYAQCDEGARDVNNIWVTAVTFTRTFSISRELSLK